MTWTIALYIAAGLILVPLIGLAAIARTWRNRTHYYPDHQDDAYDDDELPPDVAREMSEIMRRDEE